MKRINGTVIVSVFLILFVGTMLAWAATMVTLTVDITKNNGSNGTVTLDKPSGTTCTTGPCTSSYVKSQKDMVTLTAVPSSGSFFSTWSGNCSGTSLSATVEMKKDRACTAVFNKSATPMPAPPPTGESLDSFIFPPPFLGVDVKPNILVVLDRSSSMGEWAYSGQTYATTTTFVGYFDDTKCYLYDTVGTQFSDPKLQAGGCSTDRWSGSFLNWLTMRRLDIAKWGLNGGRCATVRSDPDTCPVFQVESDPHTDSHSNSLKLNVSGGFFGIAPTAFTGSSVTFSVDDGKFIVGGKTFILKIVSGAKQIGVIQAIGNRARIGLMITNGSSGIIKGSNKANKGVYIDDYTSNNLELVEAVDNVIIKSGTPLYESMFEAARYFAQVGPSVGFTQGEKDPYCFENLPSSGGGCNGGTGQWVACCKSFVIMFTDGEQSMAGALPQGLQDYAHDAGNHASTGHDGTKRHYLDDVAYWAHTNDLRPGDITSPEPINVINSTPATGLPGIQNLKVYTLFAFGDSGQKLLKEAAKMGGFDDSNGDNTPDIQSEWDKVNNTTRQPGQDGIPDTYFEAKSVKDFKTTFMSALTDILQQSASGAAASLIASSSSGEGAIYQTYFFPSVSDPLSGREVSWVGYLQSLFLDNEGQIREDTDQDGALVVTEDKIVETFFDKTNNVTKVKRYNVDAKGKKMGSPENGSAGIDLQKVLPIWEAGKLLADRLSSDRKIITWTDESRDGDVAQSEVIEFTDAKMRQLKPYLRAINDQDSKDIINFIRGDGTINGFRNRQINGKTWKLGDILNSDPTLVGMPVDAFDKRNGDDTYVPFFKKYKKRRNMIYAGGNDGMLHAFNSGFFHYGDNPMTGKVERGYFTTNPNDNSSGDILGKERWAFIPQELLPHLRWLKQDDYTKSKHVFYVDGSPRIADVRIFSNDAIHPNGWGTILIGRLRMGGGKILAVDLNADGDKTDPGEGEFRSAYFALDITDPESAAPTLLWVFKDNDLGFTTSFPTIARIDKDNWYAVFGSGPTTYRGERSLLSPVGNSGSKFGVLGASDVPSKNGFIYAVNLNQSISGKVVSAKIQADMGGSNVQYAFMGDPAAFDFDKDYVTDVIYTGKTFDPTTTSSWRGKVHRLLTNSIEGAAMIPSQWTLSTLFDPGKPVLAPVSMSRDEKMRPWVYFGTGRFFSSGQASDASSTTTQALYGIHEGHNGSTGGCWVTKERKWTYSCTNLIDPDTLFDGASVSIGMKGFVLGAGTTTISTLADTNDTSGKQGWFLKLFNGERILQKVALTSGILVVPSYTPTVKDVCGTEGNSKLYALYYKTGTAFASQWTPYGVFGTADTVTAPTAIARSIDLGAGNTSRPSIVASVDEKGVLTTTIRVIDDKGGILSTPLNRVSSLRQGSKLFREGVD